MIYEAKITCQIMTDCECWPRFRLGYLSTLDKFVEASLETKTSYIINDLAQILKI